MTNFSTTPNFQGFTEDDEGIWHNNEMFSKVEMQRDKSKMEMGGIQKDIVRCMKNVDTTELDGVIWDIRNGKGTEITLTLKLSI